MIRVLIVLTLALGPLQWITLADVGLTLKPVHIPFFALAIIGWLHAGSRRVERAEIRSVAPFAMFYSCYIALMLLSAFYNGTGFIYVMKLLVYFLASAGFFFALLRIGRQQALSAVMTGGLLSAVLFFAVASITLQLRGINIFAVVGSAVQSGNPSFLQFMIFRNVFNAPGVSSEDAVGVALRHTSLGFIFIGGVVALAASRGSRLAAAGAMFSILIILVSVSRSLILAYAIALIPAGLALLRGHPRGFAALTLGAGLILITLFIVLQPDLGGIGTILSERFGSFDEDGRVGMYGYALNEINNRAFLGYGPGYEFEHGSAKTHQAHNIFLGAWMQGGYLCLLTAIGFMASLMFMYFRSMLLTFGSVQNVLLLGLLVLPLFRSQLSGGGGNFTLAEWICIAVAVAIAVPSAHRPKHLQDRVSGTGRQPPLGALHDVTSPHLR
ncbi:O-antigen ligase family protein [Vannielia litorea]|uniref:O-Antigen ligase n=1 Tax=Vannielia litorea TaxID=1217970 RepID=A0A1N6GWE0_9RHOB|nr:O-antigen ligase family protein [Vannielia litorea]SIO11873.1 O-Antigen ligase [Vannielia litorea]